MDYDILLNVRFNRQLGPLDLSKNTWNSSNLTYNTAGKFTGTCGYFNGSDTSFVKMNGTSVNIIGNTDFTISFWLNFDPDSYTQRRQFIISGGDITSPTTKNTVYIESNANGNVYLGLINSNGNEIKTGNIRGKLNVNDWTYFAIIRKNNTLLAFVGTDNVINTVAIGEYYFDQVRMSIGTGITANNHVAVFKGYIDDIVFMRTAIPNLTTSIHIPTNYLVEDLDPSLVEDLEGWKDVETEYSCYEDIVKLTELKRTNTIKSINELQNGLCPYIISPDYYTGSPFFSNGKYTGNRSRDVTILHLFGISNNSIYAGICPDKFEAKMSVAYNKNYITPFLLFVNNKNIPWSKITIVKSDKYTVLLLDGFSTTIDITSVYIISIPFNISYSEENNLDDDAVLLFSFNNDGAFINGGNIVIGSKHPNMKSIIYRNMQFNTFKSGINLDKKITPSNFITFDENGYLNTGVTIDIISGNIITIKNTSDMTISSKSIVISYFDGANISEDYINKFPNTKLALQIAAGEKINVPIPEVDTTLFKKEFNFAHNKALSYDTNILNSLNYAFTYDKNKYDSIFEKIKPINIIEFSGSDILKKINSDGRIKFSRDIYPKLDNHDETFAILFKNGEIPDYYNTIKYTITNIYITPKANSISNGDIFELVYFRNIRNELIPLDSSHKADPNYLTISSSYIPKSDLIVYSDSLGKLNLYPVLYTLDDKTEEITLTYEKYLDTNLFIGSKNQFVYANIPMYYDTNRIVLSSKFKSCYNTDKYLLFVNGRLLNNVYYRVLIPSLTNRKIQYKAIYTMKTISKTDRVEVIYIGGNSLGIRDNFNGDLLVRPITTYATYDGQTTFTIPLPFKDYDLTNPDSVSVLRHGSYRDQSKYTIYKQDGVWTLTFLDEDDESILGEEVTFVYTYYASEFSIAEMPYETNTMQFITRQVHVTEDTKTIAFPADSIGNITSIKFIMVFKDTELVDQSKYTLNGNNNIAFTSTIPKGTDISMVIETDRYDLANNYTSLNYSTITITEKAQNIIPLGFLNRANSYIIFKNNELLNPKTFTVVNNCLVIDYKYNDLRIGDILNIICSIDSSVDSTNINFYPINISLLYTNSFDIPNFSGITISKTNTFIFINNKFIAPSLYTITGNTINLNNNYNAGDEATVYLAYKTVNSDYVSYSQSVTADPNSSIVFVEKNVNVTSDNQTVFSIPHPTKLYKDIPFIVFIRGSFVPHQEYSVTADYSQIMLADTRDQLKTGDIVTFLFCHNFENTAITKEEYTVQLTHGDNDTIQIPDVYKFDINYENRILLFYGGIYIDKKRYTINSVDRSITLNDIPYSTDVNRNFSMVFFYSSNPHTGSIGYIPESGYLKINERKLDRNYNKELYMFFVNGKKIAKSQLIDITNSLKKITVDIKSRFGLEIISCSPLISEFKTKYLSETEPTYYNINIINSDNQAIIVKYNDTLQTESFVAKEGAIIETMVKADSGYIAGTSNITTTMVNSDLNITATDAIEGVLVPITIEQKEHERISVYCNGKTYTDSFKEIAGYTIVAMVESIDDKYNSGELNIIKTTIGTDPITITVSDAIVKQCNVSIKDMNLEHQTILATIYNENIEKISELNGAGSIIVPYGSYILFTLTAERGYEVNNLGIYKTGVLYQINGDMKDIIAESPDGPKFHSVYIPKTENQKIIVQIHPANDSSSVTNYSEDFTTYHGDIYTIMVVPDAGYIAGDIYTNLDNAITGSLDSVLSITISDAEAISETVKVSVEGDGISNISVNLSNGNSITPANSGIAILGTTYTVVTSAASGYTAPEMSSISGVLLEDTVITIKTPARKLTDDDYKGMAYVEIDPKPGTTIQIYSTLDNKKYTESFHTNIGNKLYIQYGTTDDTLFTNLNTPSILDIVSDDTYKITTSYPLPISQKDYLVYLNKDKGNTANIQIDNPFNSIQLIKVSIDGIDKTNENIDSIPLGTEVTVSISSIATNGRLYINGIKIIGDSITFKIGSYGSELITQSTNLVISCTQSISDSSAIIQLAKNINTEYQNIIVSLYNNGEYKNDVVLPYNIDCNEFPYDSEIRIRSDVKDKEYTISKTNYTSIQPIDGANYIIYSADPEKQEVAK